MLLSPEHEYEVVYFSPCSRALEVALLTFSFYDLLIDFVNFLSPDVVTGPFVTEYATPFITELLEYTSSLVDLPCDSVLESVDPVVNENVPSTPYPYTAPWSTHIPTIGRRSWAGCATGSVEVGVNNLV